MIGLTSLDVYNSIFNVTKENNKFELYTDISDEFSFEELNSELEDSVNVSNISNKHLQDKELAPLIISA